MQVVKRRHWCTVQQSCSWHVSCQRIRRAMMACNVILAMLNMQFLPASSWAACKQGVGTLTSIF